MEPGLHPITNERMTLLGGALEHASHLPKQAIFRRAGRFFSYLATHRCSEGYAKGVRWAKIAILVVVAAIAVISAISGSFVIPAFLVVGLGVAFVALELSKGDWKHRKAEIVYSVALATLWGAFGVLGLTGTMVVNFAALGIAGSILSYPIFHKIKSSIEEAS